MSAFNASGVGTSLLAACLCVFAKRLELATKIDRGEMTEQQGQVETQKIYAGIRATERQRDAAR